MGFTSALKDLYGGGKLGYGRSNSILKLLAIGGGLATGTKASYKFMDKAKFNRSWNSILLSHVHEMSGWEDEAGNIFTTICKMSPSIAQDPSTAWYLIKNIKMAGGVSYPVSRKLLDLEAGVQPGSSSGLGEFHKLYGARDWASMGSDRMDSADNIDYTPFDDGGIVKHSAATSYLESPIGIKGLLARAGIASAVGAISPLLFEGFKGMKGIASKNIAWNSFSARHQPDIAGWESEAREYFFTLIKYLPDLAKDDETVLSFIKHMRSQGGIDFSVMTDLLTTSKGLAKRRSLHPTLGPLGSIMAHSLGSTLPNG
jgi:hypothetical protein